MGKIANASFYSWVDTTIYENIIYIHDDGENDLVFAQKSGGIDQKWLIKSHTSLHDRRSITIRLS
ncbi:hypothetical protein KHA93_20505 [Bacillus sp. FJAT-49732]|uniref:Uncharacterized protein n=1 Tax=Lederbergia citrisecunda TaxID=2833583 RepID=A0A942YMT0_9BACI|nr:hypothetical protein [Lederbergia citrisecunda]MBS4201992.1 hypothetical protein [Lederbergia citrisecunda]